MHKFELFFDDGETRFYYLFIIIIFFFFKVDREACLNAHKSIFVQNSKKRSYRFNEYMIFDG